MFLRDSGECQRVEVRRQDSVEGGPALVDLTLGWISRGNGGRKCENPVKAEWAEERAEENGLRIRVRVRGEEVRVAGFGVDVDMSMGTIGVTG